MNFSLSKIFQNSSNLKKYTKKLFSPQETIINVIPVNLLLPEFLIFITHPLILQPLSFPRSLIPWLLTTGITTLWRCSPRSTCWT